MPFEEGLDTDSNESNVPIDWSGFQGGTAGALFAKNPKKLMVAGKKDGRPIAYVSLQAGVASATDTAIRFALVDSAGHSATNDFVSTSSTTDSWVRAVGGDLVIKYAAATASGNTAVWTPAGGKKFRLFGFAVYLGGSSTLAAAGQEVVKITDSATTLWSDSNQVQNSALATGIFYIDFAISFPANGYLSAAVNNVLNVNLGTAINAGTGVEVTAWGLEQ